MESEELELQDEAEMMLLYDDWVSEEYEDSFDEIERDLWLMRYEREKYLYQEARRLFYETGRFPRGTSVKVKRAIYDEWK